MSTGRFQGVSQVTGKSAQFVSIWIVAENLDQAQFRCTRRTSTTHPSCSFTQYGTAPRFYSISDTTLRLFAFRFLEWSQLSWIATALVGCRTLAELGADLSFFFSVFYRPRNEDPAAATRRAVATSSSSAARTALDVSQRTRRSSASLSVTWLRVQLSEISARPASTRVWIGLYPNLHARANAGG
jgi:hypothetical protein